MKIKKAILNSIMVITLTIIFASCKKDEPITPVEPPIIPIISLEEFKSTTHWELDSLYWYGVWVTRKEITTYGDYNTVDLFPKENNCLIKHFQVKMFGDEMIVSWKDVSYEKHVFI